MSVPLTFTDVEGLLARHGLLHEDAETAFAAWSLHPSDSDGVRVQRILDHAGWVLDNPPIYDVICETCGFREVEMTLGDASRYADGHADEICEPTVVRRGGMEEGI